MLSKIECSDELLLGILNQDSGSSSELGLQHLDECEHCQTRIEELAANEQQWRLAREGLCSHVECGPDIESEFGGPTRFVPTAELSSDWTDTMAKQLLQPPSHPEMLGRLGRYEIERLVGSGGMGVVFKAYDSELHRSVAIKMLAPHLSGSRSARERFAREARAAAAIVNDHVVPIHNVETEHATPYLVMQYIAGDSLQARLDRDGPLDVCEVLRIGMQVAKGLAAAHAQGLIHRDVKPSNIMLDENVARALLTDFGLARTQDEACLTRSGFHPGTPHYMSPEQVRGEELDGRSDLFSLGCVLYALCTGHPPYRADSGYAVMRRITDEQPRSIREQNALIPEWLDRVVMKLLEKNRESRFQSAEELAQILEQCLAHVQKPTTEPLPAAVMPKASFFDRGRIRNWILAGMASAFLFLAGVFIVLETNKGTITIKSEADNVPIRIKRSDKVVDEMVVSRTGKSVRLAAGEYVIEFDGDSQDLVVEGGSISLVRGETKTLQIVYKKSDSDETRMSSDKSESTIENSDVNALAQSESLASAIDAFNRDHSAELLAANSPLLTEDELCAVLWWHANHVDFSPAPRQSLLEIVLTGRLLPGWSIQLKNVQWDEDKLWHGKPATSGAIEINLVNQEQYVAPIRFQFTSSGLESNVPANSPLADAIAEFNKHEAADQPPLTLQETLAALSTLWSKEPKRHPEEPQPSDDAVVILKQIADQHTMDGHTIESSLQEHEVGDSKFFTWKIQLRVKTHDGFLGTQWFLIRKRFIKVDSDRISARKSHAAHNNIELSKVNVDDFSVPKASTSEVAFELASAVDQFNRAHVEKMNSANTPPLTEDELVASLWWQYRQSDLTEELKEVAREIALTRTLPKGWSLGLRATKWGNDKFWETPEQTKSIEIELQRGDGKLIRIRSQYVASRLITSWNYRPESPLRSAIAKFNSQYTTTEPAITCDEVVAAISTLMENSASELAHSHGLTEQSLQTLRRVAMMHEMGDFTFEKLQSDELADGDKFATWSVRLTSAKRDSDGKTQSFEIRKRFLKVESDRISARMKAPNVLHTYETPTPLLDFSKVEISAFESDLTAAVEEFNQLHSEKLRASNLPPITEDELIASLWWQYSQSKLREEISETVKEIAITRKLPPGWSIKLNTRSWTLPQQWWHDKPLSSSAIQINLFGNEGLATTIRNQFVSSDISSIRPPESALEKAIAEFNKAHSEEGPELTLDETLAALSTLWAKQSWYSYDGLKPSTMDALMAAIDRHEMKGVKIRLAHSYQTAEGDNFDVWSIRLEVQSDQDGSTQAFTIRERFQRVNSFSDETIHWGKPSDEGLQAGFRLKPAQTRYLAGQVVDVEFFYRTIHGKGLTETIPNVFHFNKVEIDVLGGDGKQRLSVEHDREKIIGGWRAEEIGEQPKLFKNRKIRFVDSPENLAAAKQVSDDWITNVMLPINTKCEITFDVPDFADDSKNSGSLLTGSTQFTILNANADKKQLGIAPDASASPWDKHVSFLQSALDSVRRKFDEGLATQEDVLSAELELLGAKIAGTKDSKALPSLLKKREDVVQRAFLAAKAKYENGQIGIDPFSAWVAELVDAKFAARIAANGHAESQASVSQDDASLMLIEEFCVKQKMLGDFHPEVWQLRDKVLRLIFDHRFDEVGIQKRLFELNRERQQLLKTRGESHPSLRDNSVRQEAVASLRSGSFPKMLKMLVETDPRRANLLPQEWKGTWVVESATVGDGSPLDFTKGSKLSIFNSTIDWHWGEQAREAYVVNGVTVNGKQSLVDLHWRAESPNMQGGAATGDIQWLVEFRDNKLWIVRLDQPESPVPDSVDNIRRGHTRFILKRTDEQVLASDTELIQPGDKNLFKSLEIIAKSEDVPTERIRAEATKIAQQIENELGREGLWKTSELVIYVDLRERRTNAVGRLNGNPLQPLIQLDGDLSELLESTLPMQLREVAIELAQPQGPKWIQVGYSWNIQSSQSFAVHLQQMHERHQSLGVNEAFLESDELPNEFSATTSAGLVAFLKETKGMPALLAYSRDLSISNVADSIEKNLGFDSIDMLNGAFLQWIEQKYALAQHLTSTEGVEVRSNSQHPQPNSKVIDPVDSASEASKVDSQSLETFQLRKEIERLKTTVRGLQSQEKQVTHVRQLPFPKEMQGVWRINEAFKGVVEKNGRTALAQYENQIVTISDSTMFLQSNVVGNYWYLSRLDSSSSPMQVDLSVWSGSDSVYKTFACLLEIQDNKLCLVRAESPGFPRPQSVQELRRGETCFVMTRIGDSPMTPEEVIQVAKKKVFEKEDRTVRFKVESVHAPFVLGEPGDGHREGELHLDCRPDPHDFSLDQFLVVLTAECQKKLLSEGVEDLTKHFLGKTITAKGPVRGVEYTARAMRGEHFHLIVDDPSKLIIEKSE